MDITNITKLEILEQLYSKYNHSKYISPDPLEVVLEYPLISDREIVGLIAAGLAYGRVTQIVQSVRRALKSLGPHPREFLMSVNDDDLRNILKGFKHRFTTGEELGVLLIGIKRAILDFGSLNECFLKGHSLNERNIFPALARFVERLSCVFQNRCTYLLSSPNKNSACKRMNLYLKWMIRKDEVDPGGWDGVSFSKLIVPIDTHMHRICKAIGFTLRRNVNLKTALEITQAFSEINPEDPTKYDFAITRLGIRKDESPDHFIEIFRDLN
ncbi:TIGR02757 family protein [bacterium]|nr:TIGR02757 family protein [bacterium]